MADEIYKAKYNFLVNGDWEEENIHILMQEPKKGDLIHFEDTVYEIVKIALDGEYYELYLD